MILKIIILEFSDEQNYWKSYLQSYSESKLCHIVKFVCITWFASHVDTIMESKWLQVESVDLKELNKNSFDGIHFNASGIRIIY